jgi:hypothetical protein
MLDSVSSCFGISLREDYHLTQGSGRESMSSMASEFRFERKEFLVLILGTALALCSLKSDDLWVVVPMLVISGGAFIALCYWHHGKPIVRTITAVALIGALAFIGWRDLRPRPKSEESVSAPTQSPPSIIINQTAIDSTCSNIASETARLECQKKEKEKHGHEKKP